jgi:hypothetical protein
VSRRSWTGGRIAAILVMATFWIATGIVTYLFLGSHRTVASQAKKPSDTNSRQGPIRDLLGTLYLVQDGTLYRLQHGVFTAVLNAPGGASRWTQPTFNPSGDSLVVVRRDYESSDLYLIDQTGHVQAQLTHNASRIVQANHWAFYPRFSSDGRSLFFSYDRKDFGNDYNVVLSVYSMPTGGNFNQAKKWTAPVSYTGGDIQPVPLQSGGVIYTKYTFDTQASKILSQIYLTPRAGALGKALTAVQDDCSQPALSPDGQRLAMICTGGKQFANLEVAHFDGSTLTATQVVVSGQLAAQPTWSPDGASLCYLAPVGLSGHFQLWLQPLPAPVPPTAAPPAPSPTRGTAAARSTPTPRPPSPTPINTPPPQPIELTADLDFDATSTIAWHA